MEFSQALDEKKILNKILEYKGYKGSVNEDANGTYYGSIINDEKVSITFKGNTIEELEKDFKEMIDF
ncbi:MAG: hypothetical protein ACOCRX_08865 [Candidatus Woesearchaeota archaeon]